MKNKSYCSRPPRMPATRSRQRDLWFAGWVAFCVLFSASQALAGTDAPPWMHGLVNAPLPAYDEKASGVLLYSETNVTVVSSAQVIRRVREAYKILRPEGRQLGTVSVLFASQSKIKSLHGWCIPAQGKDYEVKDKDAVERSYLPAGELASDIKLRILNIPAPDPGNIVGYEYELEEHPLFLQDTWYFQDTDPVRESHYSLQLPPGWEYKASWLNHPEIKPTQAGPNLWQWSVNDVKGIRPEPFMPPVRGIAGQMVVAFFTTGDGNSDWAGMGQWYLDLIGRRVDASPQIKQQVATLVESKSGQLKKMQAVAGFVQRDIRYVSIELGIGGWQPNPASDVFAHRYGDCKDKATLARSMLREIGVESYHVLINDRRGWVTNETPAPHGFNHAIIAIRLPEGVSDPSLIATLAHPRLGRLLFFDPTNDLIPFGQLPGYLQANYGLLVTPDGSELIELPQQPAAMNSIQRAGKLTLDPNGTLKGEVKETRVGERASQERRQLRGVSAEIERVKPIEDLLGSSLTSFHIIRAALINLDQPDQPFGFTYSFESPNYAKNAGSLLLVRPRVLGKVGSGFLETKEARKFPIEFEEPATDTDAFEITIPAGYVVDDVPPPVDVDYGYASYHSKTQVKGNIVDYTRTYEVKQLSVPVDKADELRKFYRIIASDERSTVVLKPAP